MDMLSIIFFIMFLVIVGVIIYLVYDFMNYKENVDKSIQLTTDHINDTFEKVSNNIGETEVKLSQQIATNASELDVYKKSNDFQVEKLNTDVDTVKTDLDNFDASLKKYFTFMDNNSQSIVNDKIFKHVFTSINPNLKLLANIDIVSGMTIRTSDQLKNNKNLKICNSFDNCLQLNVNSDGFNITPDNVNNLVINSSNSLPLARFDMKNNSIYFGGSDINAPMFIQNSNLYVNNINMIIKPPGAKNNDLNSISIAKITGEDLYTYGNNMSNIVTATQGSFGIISDISKQVTISYTVNNKEITVTNPTDNTTNTSIINNIYFKMIANTALKTNDIIEYEIPYYEIGNVITVEPTNNIKSYTVQNVNEQIVNIQNSVIEPKQGTALFKIQITRDIHKNTPILFMIYGNMLSYKDLVDKHGITIGKLLRYDNNALETSYNNISDYLNKQEWIRK